MKNVTYVTGKTHTILGSEEQPGIIPRTIDSLFKLITSSKQKAHWNTAITFSYIEIYNEKVSQHRCRERTSSTWQLL